MSVFVSLTILQIFLMDKINHVLQPSVCCTAKWLKMEVAVVQGMASVKTAENRHGCGAGHWRASHEAVNPNTVSHVAFTDAAELTDG